jgi:hypothetical protein
LKSFPLFVVLISTFFLFFGIENIVVSFLTQKLQQHFRNFINPQKT